MHWTSTSRHSLEHVHNYASSDNQTIIHNTLILIFYLVIFHKLTITLTSMTNTIMNTTCQYSLVLRIHPLSSIISIHANNFPLWNWWQHRWKTSRFQEYQTMLYCCCCHLLFKSSSSIKSCFIFLNDSPPLISLHYILFSLPFTT